MIPFNQPFLTGKEGQYIETALRKGKFSGNGYFTKKCHDFFESHYNFGRCFLTNSATNALEMAALLCDIGEGDEVIIPSYTFVSTATPFALLGASLIFCDSSANSPNIDVKEIARKISSRTKAIVVVHYAGYACDMEGIMELAEAHQIMVIEDAAHSIHAKYKDKYLGSIGHFAALSFHETKNISCGQGGMLIVNDPKYVDRAEKIWAKGTNRLDMERGLVSKYEWVELGSNFYPSEITAAILFAQLEELKPIQARREKIWNSYAQHLHRLDDHHNIRILRPTAEQSNNYHIFCFFCQHKDERDALLEHLQKSGVLALFHYLPLHRSPFILKHETEITPCPWADRYADCTVRLPLFADLSEENVARISQVILQFYVLHPGGYALI